MNYNISIGYFLKEGIFCMAYSVQKLTEEMKFSILAGKEGLHRVIHRPDVIRCGLTLTGFYEGFSPERIQLIGQQESLYLQHMSGAERYERIDQIMQLANETPCFIFCHGTEPHPEWIELGDFYQIPILSTEVSTVRIVGQVLNMLEDVFAPEISKHGVLVEIYGVGVLITGESGVGKSETALELVNRGHRLVADDRVDIKRVGDDLVAKGPKLTEHLLEVRGLGILNMQTMYGAGNVREKEKINLIVHLDPYAPDKPYDRLGIDDNTVEILGVTVPQIVIPVSPGRNNAMIVEAAAKNNRLRRMGYNAALELSEKITQTLNQL
jgi:HPr kinase/phosphorylase